MTLSEWIASMGVGMIVLAFTAQLAGWLKSDGAPYLALNAVGAGLACLASVMIAFMPFVVLEGIWCLVAVIGLQRWWMRRAAAKQ